MKFTSMAPGALLAGLVFAAHANATTVPFAFSGAGFAGSGLLTITPDVAPADPNPLCGTAGQNPCRTDPAGAYSITAISGTFSDATDGISNATITGLVPIDPANERDATFDPLVPSSLSFINYGTYPNGLSYNNLYFPNGSPIDCAFPFSGTVLDVFGMAFTIAGGDTVDVWGDGNYNFGPLTYGAGVISDGQLLADSFAGVTFAVPEPATWALLLAGFGGLGVALRRGRRQATQRVQAL